MIPVLAVAERSLRIATARDFNTNENKLLPTGEATYFFCYNDVDLGGSFLRTALAAAHHDDARFVKQPHRNGYEHKGKRIGCGRDDGGKNE